MEVSRRRRGRWDEPEPEKRPWHSNDEIPVANEKLLNQRQEEEEEEDVQEEERQEEEEEEEEEQETVSVGRGKGMSNYMSSKSRDNVVEERGRASGKKIQDDEEEEVEKDELYIREVDMVRSSRGRDASVEVKDELSIREMYRVKSGKARDSSVEPRGRASSKVEDEDDDNDERSRGEGDDMYREEGDYDRKRGWKDSSKIGRGVKRSWSPDTRRRSRMDYEDFDRDVSDDRRDERLYRRDRDHHRDMDRDRERDHHRDRERDRETGFHRDRDLDFRNREGFNDDSDFTRDRVRDRELYRQKDGLKEKEKDAEYTYERDAWETPRQDNERAMRTHKDGQERKDKDRGSPQNSGIMSDNMDRGDLGRISPFMSGRDSGPSGDFYGNNGDDDWMGDKRMRLGEGEFRDRYFDDEDPTGLDQSFGNGGRSRISKGSQGQRGRGGGAGVNDGRSPFPGNQGAMMREMQYGGKMGRGRGGWKGGRGGGGRDGQRSSGIPPPMMGPGPGPVPLPGTGPGGVMVPHFGGHMGPPGSIPVMGPGGFPIPPYGGWSGGRGVGDISMHHGLPGPSGIHSQGARFGPNMSPGPQHNVFYNSPGPGRGASNIGHGPPYGGPSFSSRGMMPESPSNHTVPKVNAPAGLAPSRGEQNDYAQHFVDTGLRPQNFIRDVDLSDRFEEYPKLKELITRKDKLVSDNACPPMYMQMDLRTTELSLEIFGAKFDVILVDPPWEEYVRRAPGVGDSMEWWTFEEIQNLRIEAIADTPSFIFLWVGDAEGLDQGRHCLKKWGFRRCEDICWVKTNRENPTPALRHDASTILQHSKEHCLMGIRGTVRRSTDGHIIHANIDTDIIISEEPSYGSTVKPEELYHIIEHFALGKRRLELFGEDHNIRAGWITVGKNLSSSNFNAQTYCKFVGDADGKVWQGGRGNPPVEAPHLIGTTPEIEALRPKSPPPRSQQQPQAANSASQPSTTAPNTKKAPNPSQGPTSHVSQSVTSSSVIVISTTSPARGHSWGGSSGLMRGADEETTSLQIEEMKSLRIEEDRSMRLGVASCKPDQEDDDGLRDGSS